MSILPFPKHGPPREEVLSSMRAARDHDVQWHRGRVFGLVYHINDEIDELLKEASNLFFSENGLNPTAFPSLRKFETEIVTMTASLCSAGTRPRRGMSHRAGRRVCCARSRRRAIGRACNRPEITAPEMLMPITAHPALEKAAEYFDLRVVKSPVRADFRADVNAMRTAITPNTILMIGSAPSYPHGVVDPIRELAALAQERGLLFHTDACVGGFVLPFVKKLGYDVPDFDLSVPGVTSISADLHKYGYAAKGASVVLYKDAKLRRHQLFVSTDWPGGIYPSPTMAGTRPAGPIAAAWAILRYLGEEGYLEINARVMETVRYLQAGINAIPGLKILSDPEMSVFAIASDSMDVYQIADELSLRGWHLDRQQFPPCLHMTVNFVHTEVAEEFLRDLVICAEAVRRPTLQKTATSLMVRAANRLTRILP